MGINGYFLTEKGDHKDAAANLYHLLQSIDNQKLNGIFWEKAPEDLPLGLSINNRLERAAAKR